LDKPACGHIVCAQHFIDTGNTACIRPYTIHGVLAGAYKAKKEGVQGLTHASLDNGNTALCKRVRPGSLCDLQEEAITCPVCKKRVERSYPRYLYP
jgi:hypothetical protein